MLKHGLQDQYLMKLRAEYGFRMKAALETLKAEMPPTVKFTEPKGGFFIWIELPPNISALELMKRCKKREHVSFQPGNWSSVSGNFGNCIRISVGFYEEPQITEGIKRIARQLDQMIQGLD